MLAEAGRRFPDHVRLQLAKRVLAESNSASSPFTQPTDGAEIEWLKDPPEEARGKWVALIGGELVGLADSAAELKTVLEARRYEQLPVVQFVAA